MLNVVYDAQVFSWQRFGGISRYFVELIRHMPPGVETLFSDGLYSENEYLAHLNRKLTINRLNIGSFRLRKKLYEWHNNGRMRRTLDATDFDLFHPTYYNDYFLSKLRGRPFVLTIHDFTHERYPHLLPDASKVIRRKRRLAHAAERIIAISDSTRRDIIDFYGLDASKIDVIHHGATTLAGHEEAVAGLATPYLLFVGDRRGYKNFSALAEAFASLARGDSSLRLVCAGAPFSPAELKMLGSMAIADKTVAIQATEPQLLWLYRHAEVFVYPSLYEGFGLPILEAFGAHCPVAVSTTSCFPEVARDGAVYFDPTNPAAIEAAVAGLLNDPNAAHALTRRASAILGNYSWKRTAALTAATYRTALGISI